MENILSIIHPIHSMIGESLVMLFKALAMAMVPLVFWLLYLYHEGFSDADLDEIQPQPTDGAVAGRNARCVNYYDSDEAPESPDDAGEETWVEYDEGGGFRKTNIAPTKQSPSRNIEFEIFS